MTTARGGGRGARGGVRETFCGVCSFFMCSDENEMLFCDGPGCRNGYHQHCLGITAIPAGSWLGPCCSGASAGKKRPGSDATLTPGKRAAGDLGQPLDPTYDVARPPKLDKSVRRAAAGLLPGGLPSRAEVDRLADASVKPETRGERDRIQRAFRDFLVEMGEPLDSEGAYGLYLAWRVKAGIAIRTIQKEASAVKKIEGIRLPPAARLRDLMQGVRRLAEAPGDAKDPITLSELRLLKDQLLKGFAEDGKEGSRRKLRNWTYFVTAFVGFFRPTELLDLQWSHVRVGWIVGGAVQDYLIDVFPSADPGSELPVRLTIFLPESKTDTEAQGQRVYIPRSADPDRTNCPLRLIRRLYLFSRGKFVFEEQRASYEPRGLTDDTMRTVFNKALTAAGVSKARLERLSLHSFRRGGATAAAALGVSIHQRKTIGRWKSDIAFLYALVSDQQATEASSSLLASVTAGLS